MVSILRKVSIDLEKRSYDLLLSPEERRIVYTFSAVWPQYVILIGRETVWGTSRLSERTEHWKGAEASGRLMGVVVDILQSSKLCKQAFEIVNQVSHVRIIYIAALPSVAMADGSAERKGPISSLFVPGIF